MEENKDIKRKKFFKLLVKIFNWLLVLIIGGFLCIYIFYVVNTKVASYKGTTPLFSFYTIISKSMEPSINVYDVVVVKRVDASKLNKDDIITFYSTSGLFGDTPVTHRIVDIDNTNELLFTVKGDNNKENDIDKVNASNVIGKVILIIPSLGELQFFLASKNGFVLAIMIPALIIVSYDVYKIIKLIIYKNKLLRLKNKNGNI